MTKLKLICQFFGGSSQLIKSCCFFKGKNVVVIKTVDDRKISMQINYFLNPFKIIF